VAKDDLAIYIASGWSDQAGHGRIVWRSEHLRSQDVEKVASEFISELDALCGTGLISATRPLDSTPAEDEINSAKSFYAKPKTPCKLSDEQATGGREQQLEPQLPNELAGIASSILGRPIKAVDDLFKMGARSLDIMKLTGAIRRRYGIKITAAEVFESTTSVDLSRVVSEYIHKIRLEDLE
jgi:acyl carrier protein